MATRFEQQMNERMNERISAAVRDHGQEARSPPKVVTLPMRLMQAGKVGDCDTITSLLAMRDGPSTDASDETGVTALMFAARAGHLAAVQLLLSKRAALDAVSTNGSTALMWACASGHEEIVEYLLAKKPRLDSQDKVVRVHLKSWAACVCVSSLPCVFPAARATPTTH